MTIPFSAIELVEAVLQTGPIPAIVARLPFPGGAVADDLGFDAADFMALSLEDRVNMCVKLAERAQALAAAAQGPLQKHYLLIAREWLGVAEEMQRATPSED